MRVLLTGANGFIGRYLLAALLQAGHDVVPAVRDPARTDRLLPRPKSIFVDFNTDTRADTWLPRLAGIDAVVNCAGILSRRPGQSIEAIHAAAPIALFTACAQAGVKRVIQISAISARKDALTAYASTKLAADSFLAATDLDWVILKPSLVYAEGAFGGTALFRALAALPFFVPMVGSGRQTFQPIHVDDLAAAVLRAFDNPSMKRVTLAPVGPDVLSLRQIIVSLRRWLGYGRARVVPIPLPLVKMIARLGDVLGGTINTTSLHQLLIGNVGDFDAFRSASGVTPRRWDDALLMRPAQTQDRWHARLYFLRPLLRAVIATSWIVSGIVGLLDTVPLERNFSLWTVPIPPIAFTFACLLDVAIGAAVLSRWRTGLLAWVQILVVGTYTIALSVALPGLWTDPFGPLLKNFAFVMAVLVLAAVEPDR